LDRTVDLFRGSGSVLRKPTTGEIRKRTGDIGNNVEFSQIIFTDESWFRTSGYLNSRKSEYGIVKIDHEIVEGTLYTEKIGVFPGFCQGQYETKKCFVKNIKFHFFFWYTDCPKIELTFWINLLINCMMMKSTIFIFNKIEQLLTVAIET
jgi:hypothetical protein